MATIERLADSGGTRVRFGRPAPHRRGLTVCRRLSCPVMPARFHEQPPGFTTLATLGGGAWPALKFAGEPAPQEQLLEPMPGGAPGSRARPHVRTPDQKTASSCGPAARTATNSPAATDARAGSGRGARPRRGRRARAGSSTAPPPCMQSLPPRQPVAGRASLIGDP